MRPPRRRDDSGETLVELVVAVAILGVAGVAIVGGMLLSAKATTLQRNQAFGGTYVRGFAEAIQADVDRRGALLPCSTSASSYAALPVAGMPAGYTASVVSVQTWNGTAWAACSSPSATTVPQRLLLRVAVPADGPRSADERLSIVLRSPCTASGATPCAS